MGKSSFLFLLLATQATASEQQTNTKVEGQRPRGETDVMKEDDAEFWDRFLFTFDIDTYMNVNPWRKSFSFSLSEPPTRAPNPSPSASPSEPPTAAPTPSPSASPSQPPNQRPSQPPSSFPSTQPTAPCDVNVTVVCVDINETPCEDIQPPGARCVDGDLEVLSFTYQPRNTCAASRNQQYDTAQCLDLGPLPDGPVDVICVDDNGEAMTITEQNITDDGEFLYIVRPTEVGSFPDAINCTIIDEETSQPVQWNLIDTSDAELNLKETYGALQVESCNDQVCLQEVFFRNILENIGGVPSNITLVNITLNGRDPEDLVGLVELNPIPPGEKYDLEDVVFLDYCETANISYGVDIEANPPNGQKCQDEDNLIFDIEPICDIELNFTCEEQGTEIDCRQLPSIETSQCSCPTCATGLLFRYTGDSCPGQDIPGVLTCSQNGTMDLNEGQIAVSTNSDGSNPFFVSNVVPGTSITVLNAGACLEAILYIQVSAGSVVQDLTLIPGCESGNGIDLAFSLGSLDFVGFQCQDGSAFDCFSTVELDTCAINQGTLNLEISMFDLAVNGGLPVDLSDPGTNEILLPGQAFCGSSETEIYKCNGTTYSVVTRVVANDTSDIGCEDELPFDFIVPPLFTLAPSLSPSSPPSRSPSESPTAPPTADPSPSPSGLPSPVPSTSPTAPPTAPPTPPPFFITTDVSSPSPSQVPTDTPTISSTENCELTIDLECTGCTINTTELPNCTDRPFMIGMLFRGGDCAENNFSQPISEVMCTDFLNNGQVPKLGSNEAVYIRANRDPGGGDGDDETSIFDGVVTEGSVYFMFDNGRDLPADTQIRVYPAEGPRNPNTILQDVRFHASCSEPLLLKNIFGSHQLVQFENLQQGNVSCFASAETNYRITIPIEALPAGEDTLLVFNATIRTNYTNPPVTILPIVGSLICTEEAAANRSNPCTTSAIEIDFETTLSLQDPQGYLQEITILGIALNSGQRCIGQVTDEFFAPLNEA